MIVLLEVFDSSITYSVPFNPAQMTRLPAVPYPIFIKMGSNWIAWVSTVSSAVGEFGGYPLPLKRQEEKTGEDQSVYCSDAGSFEDCAQVERLFVCSPFASDGKRVWKRMKRPFP